MPEPDVFTFSGSVTLEKIYELEKVVFDRVSTLHNEQLARRASACATALLKNVQYYSCETSIQPGGRITGNGTFRLEAGRNGVFLYTTNAVPQNQLHRLELAVGQVNAMETGHIEADLKHRKEQGSGHSTTDTGTGLITLRHESGNPIVVAYTPEQQGICRVTVSIRLTPA